jgi:hypothetical protein
VRVLPCSRTWPNGQGHERFHDSIFVYTIKAESVIDPDYSFFTSLHAKSLKKCLRFLDMRHSFIHLKICQLIFFFGLSLFKVLIDVGYTYLWTLCVSQKSVTLSSHKFYKTRFANHQDRVRLTLRIASPTASCLRRASLISGYKQIPATKLIPKILLYPPLQMNDRNPFCTSLEKVFK